MDEKRKFVKRRHLGLKTRKIAAFKSKFISYCVQYRERSHVFLKCLVANLSIMISTFLVADI